MKKSKSDKGDTDTVDYKEEEVNSKLVDVRDDKPDLTGTPLDLAEVRVDNVSWSEARSEDEIREKPMDEANLEPVEEEVSSAEDPEVDELREGSSAAKSDQAMSSENITHDDLESVTIEEESYRPDDTMESQDELGTERAKMAAALSPCRLRPAQYAADTDNENRVQIQLILCCCQLLNSSQYLSVLGQSRDVQMNLSPDTQHHLLHT